MKDKNWGKECHHVMRQHPEKRKRQPIWKDLERIPPDVFILGTVEILQVNLMGGGLNPRNWYRKYKDKEACKNTANLFCFDKRIE